MGAYVGQQSIIHDRQEAKCLPVEVIELAKLLACKLLERTLSVFDIVGDVAGRKLGDRARQRGLKLR